MHIIRGHINLLKQQPAVAGAIVTIGNFDGIHHGHQALLARVVATARQRQCKSAVMSFVPHPREYFAPNAKHTNILPLRDKIKLLREFSIDYYIVLPFNDALANLTAQEFIAHILITSVQCAGIIVGDDFRFGKARQGDFALLQQYAQRYNFLAEQLTPVLHKQQRVTSTMLRNSLLQTDFAKFTEYTGRAYSITGKVVHGQQLGRTLGFPTANMHLPNFNSPLVGGIYAVRVLYQDQLYHGAASWGTRPTVSSSAQPFLEVYICNFAANIYGAYITVTFIRKIRDEQRFATMQQLQAQMAQDVVQANQAIAAS